MGKIIGVILALIVIVLFVYPFADDAYQRYLVSRRLEAVMNERVRAEFGNWQGDATSFARNLYNRCQQTQGGGAVQCDRYKFAFEQH